MTTTECSDGVTLVFNYTPLWILCGIAGAFVLLTVVVHVRNWLEERSERKSVEERKPEERELALNAAPRREALELIAKLGAVRERMSELDRALTRRREGVGWQFRIGNSDADAFRDAHPPEFPEFDLEDVFTLLRGFCAYLFVKSCDF